MVYLFNMEQWKEEWPFLMRIVDNRGTTTELSSTGDGSKIVYTITKEELLARLTPNYDH